MGGEEDRAAPVTDLPHHAFQQVRRLWVKAHKGFVHEDKLRLVEPRGDDDQLLLHAVGIGRDGLRQIAGQLKGVRVPADALAPQSGIHAENVRDEVQILDTRHVLVQVGIVRNVGNLPLAFQRLFPNGIAADVNFSRVELQNARHGFQRRGLARAVVADEAVNLTGTDVQVQVVHSLLFPVGFCQMFNVQHIVPLLFCFVSPADPPPA